MSSTALKEPVENRETTEGDLEAARARSEALEGLQHHRDTVLESYAKMANEPLETLTPKQRYRVYDLLRLNVCALPDWPLEIQGVFANTVDEAGLSSWRYALRAG